MGVGWSSKGNRATNVQPGEKGTYRREEREKGQNLSEKCGRGVGSRRKARAFAGENASSAKAGGRGTKRHKKKEF